MSSEKGLSLLGHIAELRTRITRAVIAVVITTIISFVFADKIFRILTLPIEGTPLIYIDVTEMLSIYMKVCLWSGIVLAMPFIVYQAIMFVAPALTPREKRYVYTVMPWIALMFIGGVVFAYFVLVPPAIKFLVTFGSDIATPQIRIGSYISVVTRLIVAVGVVFELPVISTFLARLGIITSKWLASKRKLALIGSFVLGAIITPTFDPINQTLVAVPLIVLYEMSIWLARLVQRKRQKEAVSLPKEAS